VFISMYLFEPSMDDSGQLIQPFLPSTSTTLTAHARLLAFSKCILGAADRTGEQNFARISHAALPSPGGKVQALVCCNLFPGYRH
jgi:hypothetical protein